jgi:hypothetical protein
MAEKTKTASEAPELTGGREREEGDGAKMAEGQGKQHRV